MRSLLFVFVLLIGGCAQSATLDDASTVDTAAPAEDDGGCVAYARPTGTCSAGICCVSSVCVMGICTSTPVDGGVAPLDSGLACSLTDEPCVANEDCCNRRHTCRGTCNY